MQALISRDNPPDHIVIETSGLALPQPLVRAFGWPDISTRVTVDGVVAVVDGKAVADGQFVSNLAAVDAQRRADDGLDHETPLSELFADQVASADMIVINKADLMGEDAASALSTRLMDEARKGVQVVRTSHGKLPIEVLLGQGAAAEDDMENRHEIHHHHHDHDDDGEHANHDDHHHDHDHDAFESFVVSRGEIPDAAAFAGQVSSVIRAHSILRLKGFVAIEGKPLRLTMQAVGPRIDTYFDQPFADGVRETRLVVIGQAGMDRVAIEKALLA